MKRRWAAPLLLAAMWAFALAVYPRLSARIPTHWNLHGQVDGWGGRSAVFLLPAIATAVALLMIVLPRIDPRRANVEKSRDELWRFVNVLLLFMAWMEAVMLAATLGWRVDMTRAALGGTGVLLVVIGNYLPRIRSNWFFGIRTPWTLSSERVWRETHRVGGRTLVAAGVVMALAMFAPAPLAEVVIIPVILVAVVVPVAYSYLAWRREAAGGAG
ncbi:MAG TPA: SdpI family protein [Longimicrobium sp.]|jgi:uncharacterized membrane protein|nr:SdpI family protein [Longimicrobium sp.]